MYSNKNMSAIKKILKAKGKKNGCRYVDEESKSLHQDLMHFV